MSRFVALSALFIALLVQPALAADLQVDPRGSDRASGTATDPWRTIQYAMRQAGAGDTVWVHAGTYVESVNIRRSGTAEAPLVVRGVDWPQLVAPKGASPEGFNVVGGVGHVVIEGFALEGFAESIFLRPDTHDIRVRDCTVRHGSVGIWIAGATGVVVEGCALTENRLGLRVSGASSDVLVRDTVSFANDDGLGCDGDADGFSVEETATAVRFEGCSALLNGEDGFDLQGDEMTVARGESRGNGCSGIKLGQHARVENTLVTGNTTGIATTSFFGAPVRTELVNDTVADNSGVQLLLRTRAADTTAPSTVLLRNLIAAGSGKVLEVEHPLVLEEDHNLFFREDTTSAAIVRHDADGEHRYTGQQINTGVWAVESGQGAGTLAVDPEFTDTDHYGVAADSPATDRGSEAGAPPTDCEDRPRPAGSAVDLGIDEALSAAVNHSPWADAGADREVAPGRRLRLSATGSVDPDGDRLTYAWAFGDGTAVATGETVTHTWTKAGEYQVALTVSDGQLSRTRTFTVRVGGATTSPTPSASPLPVGHDSSVRVVPDHLSLRLTDDRPDSARSLQVVVRNADLSPLPERPGHLVHAVVDRGDCPAALQLGAADFEPARNGVQDAMVIGGGRQRRAMVSVSVDPSSLPADGGQVRCTMLVRAVGAKEDPTPEDNVVAVQVVIQDGRSR